MVADLAGWLSTSVLQAGLSPVDIPSGAPVTGKTAGIALQSSRQIWYNQYEPAVRVFAYTRQALSPGML